jgi:hypothetical protein
MVVSNRTTCPFAEEEIAATQTINDVKTLKTIPLPVAQFRKNKGVPIPLKPST